MAASAFNARLAQAKLPSKTAFDKVSSHDSKSAVNKTKNDSTENKFKKQKTFVSSYFIGKSHFEEDGTQNYLVFQPIHKYILLIANIIYISSQKSKGLSDEIIKAPSTSGNSLSPVADYYGSKIRLKSSGGCLKQDKITCTQKTIVNIYIVYELGASSSFETDPTLENSLFGAVRLTKNADIDKYHYSGYGIGFDRRGSFSLSSSGFGKTVIIFGAAMNSSVHTNHKNCRKNVFN